MRSTLDGIIALNKPTGISSAKALYRVRSVTGQRKSGHAGSLDPAASGVLVLCLGRATKLVETIMDQPKVYRATARLDITSKSFDSERGHDPVAVDVPPTGPALESAMALFEGAIEQVPPRLSAVKVRGMPAYKRVRRDPDMQLRPRQVRIDWLYVHRYDWPELDFEMCCGRGTYVRSLIRDLGEALGTGGCLTSLRRTQVGPFAEADAWTLASLEAARQPTAYTIPLARAREMLTRQAREIPSRPTTIEG